MLKRLKEKGYLLAMATSKPLHFASQISKKFGFAPYLDVEVGSGMDEKTLATKSAVVAEVVRLLGVDSSECLMVGDRIHDAEGAKENQMDCALLRVGYAENEEEFDRAKPTYLWENFEELIQNLA
jgi:phosphoglycolate phosphatase